MSDWVTIENVPGGYRVNCARCGGEIAIRPTGWQIETFLRRLKRIERLHATCRQTAACPEPELVRS